MPLPNISHEHLVHFNCPICQKWWSIGDAPERDHWYCPWCGKELKEEKIDTGPFLGEIQLDDGTRFYQMVRLDPETGRWIPEGERYEIPVSLPGHIDPKLLPKIDWK